jgi:glycosyltransferase involved in cell wall biosynthesis
MRIIHIIPSLNKGGAERLVLDICNTLRNKEGVRVKLITFHKHNAYSFLTEKLDWTVMASVVRPSISSKWEIKVDELQREIENFQPDIIHTHLFEAEIISRSCYYPKAKWFSHAHDRMRSFNNLNLSSFGNKRKLTDYFERRYLFHRYKINGGNHFIAISNDIETFLKDILPKEIRNIHFLQNAINTKRFENSGSIASKLQGSPLKLISIGRLDENKNHQFLIDCIQDLKASELDVHLTIIGEGDQRIHLEQKIKKLNLDSDISLVGSIENVEEYLWQSDIYLHSAITEGFGLTLIEAMAAGLPVVCLDGKGNRDLIQDGENGFMVWERDPKLMVDKIVFLLENKAEYQRISNNALNFAQDFGIENYVQQLMQMYQAD